MMSYWFLKYFQLWRTIMAKKFGDKSCQTFFFISAIRCLALFISIYDHWYFHTCLPTSITDEFNWNGSWNLSLHSSAFTLGVLMILSQPTLNQIEWSNSVLHEQIKKVVHKSKKKAFTKLVPCKIGRIKYI